MFRSDETFRLGEAHAFKLNAPIIRNCFISSSLRCHEVADALFFLRIFDNYS